MFFISGMTHSSGLGGLLDAVPVKKMLHIPKKVVGGFFRKLKIRFFINCQAQFQLASQVTS